MYEDIYRIPLIINNLGTGRGVNDRFVSLRDLAPTFLNVAGVDTPDDYAGQSLIRSADEWREEIVCEFHSHLFEENSGCSVEVITNWSSTTTT